MKKLAILVAALTVPLAALADNVADIKTGVDVVVRNTGGKATLSIGGNVTTASATLPVGSSVHAPKPANSLTFAVNSGTLLPGMGLSGNITATGTDMGGIGQFQLTDSSLIGQTITFSMGGKSYSMVVSGFSGTYNAVAKQLGQPVEDPFDKNFRCSELFPDPAGPGSIRITGTVNGTPSTLDIMPNLSVLGGVALARFISSLTFNTSTNSVIEGDFTTATVTLGENAGPAGEMISLAASDNLRTSGSVMVPAGQSSATFKVAAGSEGYAFLQASLNNSPFSAIATIKVSYLLSSITLDSANSANSVTGGSVATFKVNLSRPAGKDGVVILLHSDNPNVTLGNSFVIPAGQMSGTFKCQVPLVPDTSAGTASVLTIYALTPTDENSQATVSVTVKIT